MIDPQRHLPAAVSRILEIQTDDGAIPWTENGIFDPWNHVESAMGLVVAGEHRAALRAYEYLRATQNEDGSWWGEYGNAAPIVGEERLGAPAGPKIRDTNFSTYIAVGIWHYYLVTDDLEMLRRFWPTVSRAMAFAISLQSGEGEIRWAARDPHTANDDALVAGCSAIFLSLAAAIRIAQTLGAPTLPWRAARAKLGAALRDKPQRFDRSWGSKSDFAMDWYYPVLAGVYDEAASRKRLTERWRKFVAPGEGCRCRASSDWVTTAESAELAIALCRFGLHDEARSLLNWQTRRWTRDGGFWMGTDIPTKVHWPIEKPSWTAGAMLLAADALFALSPAATIFAALADDAAHAAARTGVKLAV